MNSQLLVELAISNMKLDNINIWTSWFGQESLRLTFIMMLTPPGSDKQPGGPGELHTNWRDPGGG